MTWLVGLVRRSLWLLLIGAVGGALYAWWRDRTTPPPPEPAEWPPLDAPGASGDEARGPTTSAANAAGTKDPASTPSVSASTTPDDPGPPVSTSAANAAGDAAPDSSTIVTASGDRDDWIEPNDDGSCPIGHPVKANDNSGIFHVPGGRFYDRTRAERCYASPEAARADGYRQAKS